jgi:cell division protein FtsW
LIERMKFATTLLVTCAGGLLTLGLVMLFSAGMTIDGEDYPITPAVWTAIGLTVATVAAVLDYRHLKKVAWAGLAVAVGLLAAVLLVGEEINGARRWLRVPGLSGFSFQPSEFAKLALVIALAYYGERYQRSLSGIRGGLLLPALLVGSVLALIFLEPDWGTTILLAAVSGIMLLVAGVRWLHWLPVGLAGLGSLTFLLIHDPTRLRRVLGWLDLEANKDLPGGYQTWQSILALGSGGWTGVGLGGGMQKYGFVPYHESDFIFPMIGEELGLICTLSVVMAFVAILLCGIYIAWHARDTFGLLMGTGLGFMIGLQAFINIAVVTNVLPNKGLPLPFISRGGSNLVVMLVCVGLLVSIARRAVKVELAETALTDVEELPALRTT